MPAIKYVKKKIGKNYLVWFQNSNLYTQLEEPAWFVFSKVVKRHKTITIASECSFRYGLSYDECLQFVIDIRDNINKMNQSSFNEDQPEKYPDEIRTYEFCPYSNKLYRLSKRNILFSVENQWFESFLHPLISNYETTETCENASHFELFQLEQKSVFRVNGEIKGIYPRSETNYLIGQIYMSLINEMYNKTDDFWLMTVHAAALTNRRKTILIPAESGSGKTTMAAMLQNLGYELLSDDFVPIDRLKFQAWPFPIAMSIKHGSMEVLSNVYPSLQDKPVTITSSKKTVRYLSPKHKSDFSELVFPIHDIISIKYDPLVEFKFEKADKIKAIKLLLDQSWILPNPGNASIFLDRIAECSFYQLTYSNNELALDAISKLFDHDQ